MPDGLTFSGFLQPPSVPPDPTGDDWRGIQGPQGPAGPVGTITGAPLPTSPAGLPVGAVYVNGGVLCVVL